MPMPKDKSFDSLILDVDGTIWNTTDLVAVAWNCAIVRSGFTAEKVTGAVLKKEFGRTMDVIACDLWPGLDEGQRKLLMGLCCEEEQRALKSNETDISYPGVVGCVKELSERIPVFIVSNCQAGYIELVMSKLGLSSYITDFECYGRTGKGKADNLRLLKERNKLVSPVYVGDTQGDADACAESGIPFIWASYGFGDVPYFFAKIDSFTQIKAFFM